MPFVEVTEVSQIVIPNEVRRQNSKYRTPIPLPFRSVITGMDFCFTEMEMVEIFLGLGEKVTKYTKTEEGFQYQWYMVGGEFDGEIVTASRLLQDAFVSLLKSRIESLLVGEILW